MSNVAHIIVQFTGHFKAPVGRTVLASDGNRLPAFLSENTRVEVKPKDFWLAEVEQVGQIITGARFEGSIVRPVRRIDADYTLALNDLLKNKGLARENGKISPLGRVAQAAIMRDLRLLPLLTEALLSTTLQGNGPQSHQFDFGRWIGYESCVPAPPIDVDTVCTFATPIWSNAPVRVVTDIQPRKTYQLTFGTVRKSHSGRNAVVIAWVHTGSLVTKMEPVTARSPELRSAALDFWTRHAHVYRNDTMNEPFNSTWREVLREAKLNEADELDSELDEID